MAPSTRWTRKALSSIRRPATTIAGNWRIPKWFESCGKPTKAILPRHVCLQAQDVLQIALVGIGPEVPVGGGLN